MNMEQDDAIQSSSCNACSTILSMDCQSIEPQNTAGTANARLHLANSKKVSTSFVSSSIDDDQNQEQVEESDTDTLLHGGAMLNMITTMQFNTRSTATTPPCEEKTNTTHHQHGTSSLKATQDSPPQWNINVLNANQPIHDCLEGGYLSLSENTNLQPMPPSGFEPINSFLKLPILADPTKLELADQRLLSSYLGHGNNYKEDHYTSIALNNNNNWLHSLQLESIRQDCLRIGTENTIDESHVVHFLEHANAEDVAQDSTLEIKANNEESTSGAHENGVLNDKYTSSAMNIFTGYRTEEQLLYALNGGVEILRTQEETMFDSINGTTMVYNEGLQCNDENGAIKGCESSTIIGANLPIKTGRRRGARGSIKNSEERENQRMTHIAVERNRRRQMNEHLRVLRALMPPSYIQRGDQASIIGGAIDFVRELEQLLQCLESQKRRRLTANPPLVQQSIEYAYASDNNQLAQQQYEKDLSLVEQPDLQEGNLQNAQVYEDVAQAKSPMADIEVKVAERTKALIKILSQRRPRQLLHIMIALQDHLNFSILHTNVTTIDNTVLYSFTVKINDDDDPSANRIASVVHEVFIDIIGQVSSKII